MKELAFWLPMAVYAGILIWAVSSVLLRGESDTAHKYALGTRRYASLAVFLTTAATLIGPTYSLGVADNAFKYGWFYTIFFLFSSIQLFVSGTFFVPAIQKHAGSCRTVGDIMSLYYGRFPKALAGIFTLGQTLVFTGVLILGGATILNVVWQVPMTWGMVSVAVVATAYTALGGMAAVLLTDRFQFAFMVGGGLTAFFMIGWPALTGDVSAGPSWQYSATDFPPGEIIGIAVAFLLGEALIPIYAVRGLLSESPQIGQRAFQSAAIFGLLWFAALTVAGIGAHAFGPFEAGGEPVTNMVLLRAGIARAGTTVLGHLLLGLMTAAFLGVVMSTFDSVLNAGAVSFVRDGLGSLLKINDEQEFRYVKLVAAMLGVLGPVVAATSDNLVTILLIGYNIWVPTIVPPLAYALLGGRKVGARSAATAIMCGGLVAWIGDSILNVPWLPGIVLGIVANLIILLVGRQSYKTRIEAEA